MIDAEIISKCNIRYFVRVQKLKNYFDGFALKKRRQNWICFLLCSILCRVISDSNNKTWAHVG